MAVYTKINTNDLTLFLKNYSIEKVNNFLGIKEGVENSNYLLNTKNKKYILTIYEKRVSKNDLPFFMELMNTLNKSNFRCPKPILNYKKKYIGKIHNKPAAIVSFLEGKAKNELSPEDCFEIGREIAKFHKITKKISIKRKNSLSVNSWVKIFKKVESRCAAIEKNLDLKIKNSLSEIKGNWPKKLPSGIIHADLFPDNIFFKNNKFSGFIDFYFSCNDFYALEIAICFNALCFDGPKNNLSFNVTKAINFMNGYSQIRKITNDEKKYIKVLSQGSALRFLLTRVFDSLNTVEGAIVKVKDPVEYLVRLEFHKNSKNFEDYFF